MPALECGGVAENHSSLISLLPLENPSGLKPLDQGSFTISGLHLTFLPFTKMSFFTDKEEVQRSATSLGYVAQKCTKGLVKVLKDVVNSAYAPEYDVSGIADRFLHIRLLRLLCVLGQGDADASDCMNDILSQTLFIIPTMLPRLLQRMGKIQVLFWRTDERKFSSSVDHLTSATSPSMLSTESRSTGLVF